MTVISCFLFSVSGFSLNIVKPVSSLPLAEHLLVNYTVFLYCSFVWVLVFWILFFYLIVHFFKLHQTQEGSLLRGYVDGTVKEPTILENLFLKICPLNIKNCQSILGLNLYCRKSYEKSQQLRVPGKSNQIQFVIQNLKTIPNNVVLDFFFFFT